MTRFSPRLLPVLLCAAALGGCSMSTMMGGDAPERTVAKAPPAQGYANDIDGNVRQAQLLRLAGKHDEAIQILSQLTLIAADNPRVVGEYGKALAQKGRAQDATQFLRRAIELSPDDSSLYSALGVAYDQTADHVSARASYERALMLRPGDAMVLNNYALSRMMAKDPDGARRLIALARGANATDEKIARNVEMINRMAPDGTIAPAPRPVAVAAAGKGSPAPVAETPRPAQVVAPAQVARAPQPPIPVTDAATDVALAVAARTAQADAAPRTLVQPQAAPSAAELEMTALAVAEQTAPQERRVVMQAVPFDPLAGPVKAKPRPRVAAAKKAQPTRQAEVPSLRVATESY
jgi:Flp pilus assembly protein TadD